MDGRVSEGGSRQKPSWNEILSILLEVSSRGSSFSQKEGFGYIDYYDVFLDAYNRGADSI